MEEIILNKLISDKKYGTNIIPFIKIDYFSDKNNQRILTLILEHQKEYNRICTFDELEFDIRDKINESLIEEISENFNKIKNNKHEIKFDKLLNDTEKFFHNSAIQNAIIQCAEDIQNSDMDDYNHFPEILKNALGVSFNKTIGIDFKDPTDILNRYESYVNRPEKIKLGTKLFNYITDGGYERKTLNIYIAPTHIGKTWKLIDDAAHLFLNGYNVLYVTLEMSKEKIMQRIETNLFELPTAEFRHLSFEEYKKKLSGTKKKSLKLGKLIVEEFPTGAANINHILILLDELNLKKDFVPDIIIVDYLAIMQCANTKIAGMYEINKKIAEELRRVAVETNTCLITAVQTNRDGFDNSDFTLTSTSESIGITFTADCVIALIRDETLDDMQEAWVKVLKNRYCPIVNSKFVIGINILHQKFFDVENPNTPGNNTTNIKEDLKKLI